MPFLLLVSLLWAFSFGLIKGRLAGLDPAFISAVRLGLALLVFLPFLRVGRLSVAACGAFAGTGAVQFGLMYLAYNESFRYLQAYEVALFTITTPIFVTILADVLGRTFRLRALVAAMLAVAGAAVVVLRSAEIQVTLVGLVLVQISNLAFALGQVVYQRLRIRHPDLRDRAVFGLLYAGAFIVALCAMLVHGAAAVPNASEAATLLYLGVIASGLGFFMWNLGATRVSSGTLAAMNNLKIPLAIACSLIVFGESANPLRLAASLGLMGGAVWLAEGRPRLSRLVRSRASPRKPV